MPSPSTRWRSTWPGRWARRSAGWWSPLWGPSTAFGLNALSYLGIIGVILSLGGAFRAGETTTVGSAVATGLRFARYTPVFRTLLLIAAGFAVTSAPIQAILPNFTSDVLGGGELMYGLLLGAMGIGALVAAFTRPRLGASAGREDGPAVDGRLRAVRHRAGSRPNPGAGVGRRWR